jgi:hypothetical protein
VTELADLLVGSGVELQHPRPALILAGNPAAGAAKTFTVPGAVEWVLELVSFGLTASAGAANRFPRVELLDHDAVAFASFLTPFKLTANNVTRASFAKGLASFGADDLAAMGQALPELHLTAGLSIRLGALNLQAGDQLGTPALYVRQYDVRD